MKDEYPSSKVAEQRDPYLSTVPKDLGLPGAWEKQIRYGEGDQAPLGFARGSLVAASASMKCARLMFDVDSLHNTVSLADLTDIRPMRIKRSEEFERKRPKFRP